MANLLYLVGIIVVSSYSGAAYVPTYKACPRNDNKCLLSSVKTVLAELITGIPDMGIGSIDPMIIESGKSEGPNYQFSYKNLKFTGTKDIKVINVLRDADANKVSLDFELPVHFEGQYEFNGKLLSSNLVGKGDMMARTDKIKISVTAEIKRKTNDAGQTNFKITSADFKYDILSKPQLKLYDLFEGDKAKEDSFQKIIDENSEIVIQEIGVPIIKDVVDQLVKVLNKYLQGVPSDNIELP